jgi:hypothetical protein
VNDWMPVVVTLVEILACSISFEELKIGDLSLRLTYVLALEWIEFCLEVEETTAERPNINLGAKISAVLYDLGRREVYMPSEALTSQQLFEIVRQADSVELDDAVVQMDTCWVHVPVHYALLVQIRERTAKLSEDRELLFKVECRLTELFPARDVVRTLRSEN